MDNLNKTISFILGLVVVLVFLAVITGRLNLKGKLPVFSGKTTSVSITPIPSSQPTPQPTMITGNNNYQTTSGKTPSSIPATGSPTLLLPILLSGLSGGFFLKKKAEK
jgi:hypothetical protein